MTDIVNKVGVNDISGNKNKTKNLSAFLVFSQLPIKADYLTFDTQKTFNFL